MTVHFERMAIIQPEDLDLDDDADPKQVVTTFTSAPSDSTCS